MPSKMDFSLTDLRPPVTSIRRFHADCRSFGARVLLTSVILLNVSLLFVLLISATGLAPRTIVVHTGTVPAASPPADNPADRAAAHSAPKRQTSGPPSDKEGLPANSTTPAISVPSTPRSIESTTQTQRTDPTEKLKLFPEESFAPWQLFINQSFWDVGHKSQQLGMGGATGMDLRAAVEAAVRQLNAALPPHRRNYSQQQLLEGRFRTQPGVGTEYVVQLTSLERPGAVETVHVLRPAGDTQASLLPSYSPRQLVYLVVPYYARPQSLAKFAVQFADLVTAARENIQMALVFHWSGQPAVSAQRLRQDYARAAAALQRINQRVGRPVARLISVKEPFSRGRALLAGAASWSGPSDVLLFLCDVDMALNSRALQRCRANTAAGLSVYYPIVFSTYNPRIYARARQKKEQSLWQHHPIEEGIGFWRDFGYGMTCQYKSDFDTVAGSYLIRSSWGGEDLDLFKQYCKKGYDVVRVPDPDLVHVYHPKQCEQAGSFLESCRKSRIQTEASAQTWAKFIYELKQAEASRQQLAELLALVEMKDVTAAPQTTAAAAVTTASPAPSVSARRTSPRRWTTKLLTRLLSLPGASRKPRHNAKRTSRPVR